MVTDNGHWSYCCIVILRRKGRKRWSGGKAAYNCASAGDPPSGGSGAAVLAAPSCGANDEAESRTAMRTTTTAAQPASACAEPTTRSRRREESRGAAPKLCALCRRETGASCPCRRRPPMLGCGRRRPPRAAGGRFARLCDVWRGAAAAGKLRWPSAACLRWLLVVFLYLHLMAPNAVAAVDVGSSLRELRPTVAANSSNREICSSLDIRNTVQSFSQLNDCRVIEGFLQIVLMDRTNESDFKNLTFPKLREITGYLLLYRVNGLTTLANLFPNLTVIRGHDLFMNYALVVYEMLHLQELGLYSLSDIPRGYVFITKNPLLCYIDTIDWARIVANGKDTNFIFDNRQSNACPKCPSFSSNPLCGYNNQTKQSNCWNSQHCQKTCPHHCSSNHCTDTGECCHDYCLGGCSGNDSDHCFACKKVFLESINRCVSKCPDQYYMFKDRRCLTARECHEMPKPKEETGPHVRAKPYKAFNGTCIIECPVGFQETSYMENGQKLFRCEECSGTCRKICDATNVDSIQSAQRLKGCVVINGSLEIQMRGGGNIVRELEDSLNMIEEITGYLKIVRSLSLISLNFLRRLKLIKGDSLENGKYVLVVLDNQNLAELWDFSRRDSLLKVGNGRIFFHFNPKLCFDKITELKSRLGLGSDQNDLEVSKTSNGDKVACNITALHVSVAQLAHDHCLISWIPYNHFEMRTLLGYVVFYMEVPFHVNVSMNDGRDACGGDGYVCLHLHFKSTIVGVRCWKSVDVEVPDAASNTNASRDNITHPITHLKPYTRYAYYVRTYTIASEQNGAQSKIQYFITNPSTPTPPRQLKFKTILSSEIVIQWQPPEQVNGQLEKYVIHVEPTYSNPISTQRNYCKQPVDAEKDAKEELKKQQYLRQTTEKRMDECSCQPAENLPKIKKNDQDIQALIEFENKLHDNIYVKQPQHSPSATPTSVAPKAKRSINYLNLDNDPSHGTFKRELLLTSSEITGGNASTPLKNISGSLKISNNSFSFETNATTNELRITNLTHFTDYTINIQACRKKLDPAPPLPAACSAEKMETVQTLPLDDADKIDEKSVEVEVLNDTNLVKLKWMEPQKTNGPILTYTISYKKVDVENQLAQIQCIPNHNHVTEYELRNLPSGNYSVTIRATTLAKESIHATEPRYFYIKEKEQPIMNQLLLGALFAIIAMIVVGVLGVVGFRYFYPDSWSHRKFLFATVNPEYFKPIEGYDKWEISRRKIAMDNLLGIGHFGEVYEGRAKGIIQKGVTTKVAIKTLNKSPANSRTWSNFLNEASVMKQFDTHHVVRLLGVVTKGEPLVIMELMAKGDLRTYLRSCRADVPEEERKGPLQPPPSLKEILRMAAEISDGMLYLSDKKFVHRDLAARNCMINTEGTVKIGDFGLTRDVYETDYYRKDSKGHLPVRWMAPESLRDGIFTSRSDVWSYGVVLWEMATLASLPYTGLANGEVMPYVMNGGVMEEPENCPPILAVIMKQCWQYKYIQRPTFSEILEILLPFVDDGFSEVSYYHTEEAIQLRASNAEAVAEEDTPYTPLGIRGDFEDFSLDSDDNDEDEDEEEQQRALGDEEDEEEEVTATVVDEEDEEVKEQQRNHCGSRGPASLQHAALGRASSNDALAGVAGAGNASVHSLPTVNGYIRRPHNLIPLVNTKTTPC